MLGKRVFIAGLLVSVAGAGLVSPALAQGTATASQGTAATDDTGALQEIVVTANKREENLQRTPLAISAVSAAQLDLRGLKEVKDLSAIAPNVSVLGGATNATTSVITIRGIPTPADEVQTNDSPIGMYIDGVYLARSAATTFEVGEIERVEVLRGPQGTLFGRNTTGGAINFITKRPSGDASVKLRAGVGNYGMWTGRAVVNSGDMGNVRVSLSYLHRQRNGVVDNLLQPDKARDPGSVNVDSGRAAIEWRPADNFTVYNVFDYSHITGTPHVAQLIAAGDGTFRPNVTLDGNTFTRVQPANVQGYLNLATVLEPGCDKTVTRAYRSSLCNNAADTSTDVIWGNMLRMELELPTVTLRSTSAFRRWTNTIRGSDLDGLGTLNGPLFNIGSPTAPTALFTGFPTSVLTNFGIPAAVASNLVAGSVPRISQPLFSATNQRDQRQFSQEFELVSNTDGPFQWVTGMYFFTENGHERNPQQFGFVLDTNQAVYNTATFTNVLNNFQYPAAQVAVLAPQMAAAFQAANPARYRVVPGGAVLDYTASSQSMALYGQASYRPGGKDGALGITLGLRYTWDTKSVNRIQNGAAPFTPAELLINKERKTFGAPSGHLTVDYRPADNVNLYARVARGYRSGGYNVRQTTSVANPVIPLLPFNEEKIWSYEVGAKMQFLDRIRLNVAAFHNVYSNQLVTVPIPIVGGGAFGTAIINAGKTTFTGIELEGAFQLTDNFSIDGNFGYTKIKVKDFPGNDITGVRRNIAGLITPGAYSPAYTGSIAANLTVPLSGPTRAVARVGYNYTSKYTMYPNTLAAAFPVESGGDARGLVDAQLRIDRFGPNEGMAFTIWGKNLTNKHYITRTVDFGALGFANGIYADPRTFGATLDVSF